ncbi:N-acetyltransferase [Erysipelotrichaceae bacterium OttesenSCG-928-M19]|nr:N-acetyltransferase [Erysipelotrichaceae bacterium OttesenSCG-928-M19]
MNLIYKFEDTDTTGKYIVFDNNVEIGEITFSKAGDSIYIVDHTYVDLDYRGNKIANELLRLVVEKAKSDERLIIPLCPFAKKEFERTPEYQEIEKK